MFFNAFHVWVISVSKQHSAVLELDGIQMALWNTLL